MSQMHKKCLMASAGTHLLLLLIVLVGPAFLVSRDQADDMPVLTFIPDKLIDEPFSGGGNPQVQPPPPTPQVQPNPRPPTPAPQTQPRVESKPAPKEEPKRYTPADKIKPNLKPVQDSPKSRPAPPQPDASKEIANTRSRLNRNLSPSTTIDTPSLGAGGGPAYANYAQAIKTLYERAWEPPRESSRDDAIVKVRVVILRDGTIRSARVINGCGDSLIDGSVEGALRRVERAPAFPEGAKDSERTFIIGFNLKARLTG